MQTQSLRSHGKGGFQASGAVLGLSVLWNGGNFFGLEIHFAQETFQVYRYTNQTFADDKP